MNTSRNTNKPAANTGRTPEFDAANPHPVWLESRKRLIRVLHQNELDKDENGKPDLSKAYQVSHANVGNSGFSFGTMQVDLAQGDRKAKVEELLGLLRTHDPAYAKLTATQWEKKKEEIEENLTKKMSPGALGDASDENSVRARINKVLKTEDGRALIDRWDRKQVADVQRQTWEVIQEARKNPRYKTDPAYRAFVEGLVFKVWVGDNINQLGEPNNLKKWIRGDKAEFKSGATVKMETDPAKKPWSVAMLADYERHYEMVRIHANGGARDLRRRRGNIAKEFGLTKAWAPMINKTYRSHFERTGGRIVAENETLSSIAKDMGVSLEALKKANPQIKDINKIKVGQLIKAPKPAAADNDPGPSEGPDATLSPENKAPVAGGAPGPGAKPEQRVPGPGADPAGPPHPATPAQPRTAPIQFDDGSDPSIDPPAFGEAEPGSGRPVQVAQNSDARTVVGITARQAAAQLENLKHDEAFLKRLVNSDPEAQRRVNRLALIKAGLAEPEPGDRVLIRLPVEMEDFIKLSSQPPTGAAAAQLKPADRLTRAEIDALRTELINMPQTDPRHRAILSLLEQATKHGGRARRPVPPMSPEGKPLSHATRDIAKRVADRSLEVGAEKSVKALQTGLNGLVAKGRRQVEAEPDAGSGAPGPQIQTAESLKVDGVPGPKTRDTLMKSVAAFGAGPVNSAFDDALHRFDEAEEQDGKKSNGESFGHIT